MAQIAKVSDADLAYYNGAAKKLSTESSTLISSSPYLNHPELRTLISQEMLRRNGADLPSTAFIPNVVGILNELEDYGQISALFEQEKTRLPAFKSWLENKKLSNFTLAEVKDAKPGTLRAVLHDFLAHSGYDMDHFYQGMKVETDLEFYYKERVLTHDIEHMISGFETDHGGEIALLTANSRAIYKFFTPDLANFFMRPMNYLRAKSIMKAGLFYPESAAHMQDFEDTGAAQGRCWKHPLFLIPYRDLVDWQVQDIREEYGISQVLPSGHWSWTTAHSQDPQNVEPAIRQAAE